MRFYRLGLMLGADCSQLAYEILADADGRGHGSGSIETAQLLLRRLLSSSEPSESMERCWNWRADSLDLRQTVARRGSLYNGYPNSAGYFGSFCLDGLAMALHAIATTDSFGAAVESCVNM